MSFSCWPVVDPIGGTESEAIKGEVKNVFFRTNKNTSLVGECKKVKSHALE